MKTVNIQDRADETKEVFQCDRRGESGLSDGTIVTEESTRGLQRSSQQLGLSNFKTKQERFLFHKRRTAQNIAAREKKKGEKGQVTAIGDVGDRRAGRRGVEPNGKKHSRLEE